MNIVKEKQEDSDEFIGDCIIESYAIQLSALDGQMTILKNVEIMN